MKIESRDLQNDLYLIAPEVSEALAAGRPVVALESAALSRGFDRELAIEVEQQSEYAIRDRGAVPALLFLRDGRIHVGAEPADLEEIAGNRKIERASRSNLIGVLDKVGCGVTTVSASMMICEAVGIRFLAVGGIGGVHHGAFQPIDPAGAVTLDVSPDLDELARSAVVVVASGAKSFLDLSATLQWLETRGVPVVTFGSQTVPGYFTTDSAEKSPIVVNSLENGARLIERHFALHPGIGLLYCVPVPQEAALSTEEVERATRVANMEVAQRRIAGGQVTAAVLEVIARETGNKTTRAQVALSIRNAAVAAELAVKVSVRVRS